MFFRIFQRNDYLRTQAIPLLAVVLSLAPAEFLLYHLERTIDEVLKILYEDDFSLGRTKSSRVALALQGIDKPLKNDGRCN